MKWTACLWFWLCNSTNVIAMLSYFLHELIIKLVVVLLRRLWRGLSAQETRYDLNIIRHLWCGGARWPYTATSRVLPTQLEIDGSRSIIAIGVNLLPSFCQINVHRSRPVINIGVNPFHSFRPAHQVCADGSRPVVVIIVNPSIKTKNVVRGWESIQVPVALLLSLKTGEKVMCQKHIHDM